MNTLLYQVSSRRQLLSPMVYPIFGELIPLIVGSTALIIEEELLARMLKSGRQSVLEIAGHSGTAMGVREAA